MAQQGERKGFIARMLEGKERDEDYARSTLPTNRWSLFFDIFKGRFSKLVIINLLMILFCLPLIILYFMRMAYISAQGAIMPFSGWMGIGYPSTPDIVGLPQQIMVSTNLLFGALMIAASIIASVGIAGGIYVIRNLVWTEGVFVANDFWRGIKINFIVILQSTIFYGVLLYGFTLSISYANYAIAIGESTVLFNISVVVTYIAIVLLTIMYLWMVSMGGNYKLKFFQLLKNAFLMTFAFIFQNVFFVILMAIPLLLMLFGSFFTMIGGAIMLLFGISYMLLVWFDYSQWVFDKYFESKREGGKVNRGIYSKDKKGGQQSKAVQQYLAAEEEASKIKSDLASRPIKPITDELEVYELPESFSREDLRKLRESKERIVEDTEKYAEEHKDDERFVVYNARFEEPKEEEKGKGKKDKKKDKDGKQ